MEFFKSPYYVPAAEITPVEDVLLTYEEVTHRKWLRNMVTVKSSGASFPYSVLEQYLIRFPVLTNYRLSREVIVSNWEEVTDLKGSRARYTPPIKDGDLSVLYNKVYYHAESEFFAMMAPPREDDTQSNHVLTLKLYSPIGANQEEGINKLLKDKSLIEYTRENRPGLSVLVNTRTGLSLRYNKLQSVDIDFDTMYPSEFKDASKEIVKAVDDDSKAGLIIIHGQPGTGKTNYLRWLTSQTERRIVFIPPEMVTQLTRPEFVTFLLENKGLAFIVEDAESTLSPRMGSEKSIVSTILNLTDGLLGDVLQCQFICTFNTELTNIDPALLRPGRLLVRQEFRNLTVEESNKYLESVDSDVRVDKDTSLAELTNIKSPPTVSESKPKRTFGFINN